MSEIPLGRFCWYELLTTDTEAAPAFYGALAGWTTTVWETDHSPPYTMWMNGEVPIGGMMKKPPEAAEAPAHWLAHVSTPDLEATVAKATELGAEILAKMEVPTVGEFAVLRDPQGAVISAYQPAGETPGHDGPPQLGEFSWSELPTEDWEAAWSFYSELFGWKQLSLGDMGPAGKYLEYGRGDRPLGGIFNRPPHVPVSAWVFYIRVPDVADSVRKVEELGGRVLNGPMEVPGGDLIAHCLDPQGAAFALHSKVAEAGSA